MAAERWALAALMLLGGLVQAGPTVESWQTSGGARVLYVNAPDLPMVDVRVVLDAGSARDGGLPGLAQFTNAMLDEGAGDWDADALALRLEERGIQLGNGSLRDMAWVSVRSLVEPEVLDAALGSMNAVLARPQFSADAIERVREQMQAGLRSSQQSPASVAQRLFYRTLYNDHPYAHWPGGDEQSLAEIGREDLQRFHDQY